MEPLTKLREIAQEPLARIKEFKDKPLDEKRKSIERFKQQVPRNLFTKQTFCPRLWGEVFISDYADVYACCHWKPFKVGNLRENTLEEIWNSRRSRAARTMSLNRGLYCYDRCNLLSDEEVAASATDKHSSVAIYSGLKRVKILFGELCNLACIMCNQDHRSKRQLSLELLQEQIDWTYLEDIEFQGGEPLAMKEVKRTYRWLTEEMGKKVNFLTNGTLINEEWAERIALGSTWLYFSVNGVEAETFELVNKGAKLKKVHQCLDRVLNARERVGSELELVGHYTMVPENIIEADRWPEEAARLGFDTVDYGFDYASIPRWIKKNPSEADRLRDAFREILKDPPVPIRTHRLSFLGLVA